MQLLLGFVIAVVIAYAAFRACSLDRSGALAAVLVGTVIFGAGGWQWAVLLLAFFISSSLLTRAFKDRKRAVNQVYAKSGARDAGQVLGNGALATLFAGLNYFFPHYPYDSLLWIGFAASLAAANADTWATELGVLNPHPPRLITNFKPVEPGSSGGISPVGTLAALAGAALIGLLAALLVPVVRLPLVTDSWLLGSMITVAGLLGSLCDSLLGATVQAIYWCPTDQKETERHPLHTCGTPTTLLRGWPWLGNDRVNFACACFGATVALAGFAGLP
jgi:uncharacterized protein (TIGR00297 family)